jgi:hypothetical protein
MRLNFIIPNFPLLKNPAGNLQYLQQRKQFPLAPLKPESTRPVSAVAAQVYISNMDSVLLKL